MENVDDDTLRSRHFKQLKGSLQALALRPSEQLALFPDFVVKADELALEFDHWAFTVRANYGDELSGPQVAALTALDEKFATMSRDGAEFDPELWTDAALRSNVSWDKVRDLATAALEAFGWSAQALPSA